MAIDTLTEEERNLVESVIAEIESVEESLEAGTDVGRPEEPAALRKMQRTYTALVINHSEQALRIAKLEAEIKTADELLSRWLADVRGDYRYEVETRAFIMRKQKP